MPTEDITRLTVRKSKRFFFGILILIFLGWAWLDSQRNRTLLDVRIGTRTLLLERHTGTTRLVPGWPVSDPGVSLRHYRLGNPSDVPAICAERHLSCYQLRDANIIRPFLILWATALLVRAIQLKRLTGPDRAPHA